MTKKVLVSVWAKQYETSKPIADGEVVDMETGEKWRTDKAGYAQLQVEPGRKLTLKFNKASFPPVQTASVVVPENGLSGENHEITLQVPGKKLYEALKLALGRPKKGKHHVVTTVSALGKNLHDDRGEDGVVVTLKSTDGKTVRGDGVYLGTVMGKTEWLRPIATARLPGLKRFRHKSTSHDGGAMFLNVPPGDYILEATKMGKDGHPVLFTISHVTVRKDSPDLINVSPPHSPHVLRKPKP
ncbi:MAG: hypothetical protein ACAH83_10000 [Alphaproteobacteria bacterium]